MQNYISVIQEERSRSKWLSFDVCQQILEYAVENQSDEISGLGYYYLAEYYWFHEEDERAAECLKECAKYFQITEMHEYLARAYNMMGAVSDRRNNSMAALNYFYSALQWAEKYHFTYVQAMAENNIAFALVRMKMHREAIKRYRNAIECYQQSEETYCRRGNQFMCMIECGFCHMRLEEKEEVFALEGQIGEMLRQYPKMEYSHESLWLFYAVCADMRGNKTKTDEFLDKILQSLRQDDTREDFIRNLVIVTAFLDRLQDDDRMEQMVGIIPWDKMDKYIGFYLDSYPFIGNFLLRKNRMEEYARYTRRYFGLYERREQETRQAAVMVLDLKAQIRLGETEQNNIRAHNLQLEEIAMHDSMTGLANRTYLNEYMAKQFEEALSRQTLLGVELIDIDCFKQYNDTYGHLIGDKCIKAIAEVLQSVQEERIFCARYGGDEFMLIYSGMSLEEIRETAKIIQDRVRKLGIPHIYSLTANHVTVSQGIFARIPTKENREWDFNAMADEALYEAKRVGRNCFCVRTEF